MTEAHPLTSLWACFCGQVWGSVSLPSSAIQGGLGRGARSEEAPRALHSCAKFSTRDCGHIAPDCLPPRGAAATCMEVTSGPQGPARDQPHHVREGCGAQGSPEVSLGSATVRGNHMAALLRWAIHKDQDFPPPSACLVRRAAAANPQAVPAGHRDVGPPVCRSYKPWCFQVDPRRLSCEPIQPTYGSRDPDRGCARDPALFL